MNKKIEELKVGEIVECGFYQPVKIVKITKLKKYWIFTLWLYEKNRRTKVSIRIESLCKRKVLVKKETF